jgi:REP element-mobilizing transposase RayT
VPEAGDAETTQGGKRTVRIRPGAPAGFCALCAEASGDASLRGDDGFCVGDGVLDVPNVRLSPYGKIVAETLREMEETYAWLALDRYVIMPNHIHMILQIPAGGAEHTIGEYVGMFKSLTLNYWRKICNREGKVMGTLWQRNYYEHILRNEADYLEKLRYIQENPDDWVLDELYRAE